MGEGLYNHDTPDGYAMNSAGWNGPDNSRCGSKSPGRSARDRPACSSPPNRGRWITGLPAVAECALFRRSAPRAAPGHAGGARPGHFAAGLEFPVPVQSRTSCSDRRGFACAVVICSRHSGPLTVAARVWAAPMPVPRLLVVFLRGAYDAANVVIPVSSDFYYQARPSLCGAAALYRRGRTPRWRWTRTGDCTRRWRKPSSRSGRKSRSPSSPSPGTDDLTRSHFETQDTIELGQPVQGSRNYRSGFMGGWPACSRRRGRSRLPTSCR